MANDKILHVLKSIPQLYPGPGGAVAVVQNGELAGENVWGYADVERREPMTNHTLMPICSITKQMLCGVLTDLKQNPLPTTASKGDFEKQLSDRLRQILPPQVGQDPELTITRLCNMQSGLRDYWALTTLWGARPEDPFSIEKHNALMLERLKSFHFPPGSEFSYANSNFNILARLIEDVTERSLGDLLRERIFTPAGMATASLSADTAKQPGPCVGYEGDLQHGFTPATNRIEWAGDAGVVASLTDMIAYERYIDRSWADPHSWYRSNAEPQVYKNGEPAKYGFGLSCRDVANVSVVGHGGALRGYRLHRLYASDQRLSVVVMLNHEADAGAVADYILKKVLGASDSQSLIDDPAPSWFGSFFDPQTQLVTKVNKGGKGKVQIVEAGSSETLTINQPDRAQSQNIIASINEDVLTIRRFKDNRDIQARRLSEDSKEDLHVDSFGALPGEYHCGEIQSVFHCADRGNMLYGSFDGFLGQGPVALLQHIGEDVWVLNCARGMDAPAPGDWTVVFNRDKDGAVVSVTIGCWLARRLEFVKNR